MERGILPIIITHPRNSGEPKKDKRMSPTLETPFSAEHSMVGYIFQIRYALLVSLQKVRKNVEFTVSIETFDDVVFDGGVNAKELLQTKHHIDRKGDLSDASVDLWKTIRIWCEYAKQKGITDDKTFFLITTSQASEGSIAYYLRDGKARDLQKAIERLNEVAMSSTNATNTPCYDSFKTLGKELRDVLFSRIFIVDAAPSIKDIDTALNNELAFVTERKFLEQLIKRLEGWWFQRTIKHLNDTSREPILREEIDAEITRLREQFKDDNLPIDDDIINAEVDASGYKNRVFVHQLELIEINRNRIMFAIRDYFRAFEQRSRWLQNGLLLVGDLSRYEKKLIEEWQLQFEQMKQNIGEEAAEEEKKRIAQELYKWVESNSHQLIRSGVTEPFVARGTYQILADIKTVGWHPEFITRLQQLLETEEVIH